MNELLIFHHRLKQAREEHGMTQVDAAKHLKIARQTYLDLENGRTQPRLDTLLELSKMFNKSIMFFAGDRPSLDEFDTLELLAELQQRYVTLSTDRTEEATAQPE
ncbi:MULTISPECIES: helix-turn-helix transcriptional regulator [unclassified Photobacterium]|uniref:helix-turn-helix transcriptional regulator n=1 Tax=unclassified Photobacterium TaxID=2628852 RepID=UPI000D156436|nr:MULTISPECIES: helix-turn-helix transcriptional regulator [unclassified Photobacterium]PSV25217.1 XRE family transcriptional regulator [Photobacterium sp. GB-56]PSV29240.1 XRE family transcriptional regulator [Photobacterium sp. GB-72]PSV32700.1 XRE family transcriptional regulator [Photobacterium sp. GB-27]PSV33688.1 XRE family transcriptional regulator [Photobacterium sp. GB-210]PSV42051.1 XRE family transcriptional regulator [Photobacterium sp. GB-36]